MLKYRNFLIISIGIGILSIFFVGSISAQSIMEEYKEALQKTKESGKSEEDKVAHLKKSLTQALRNAMLRYHNLPDLDIKESDFKYEQSKDDAFTYFIKYNNYIGFFAFPNDPRLELSYPRSEKIILVPGKEPMKAKENTKEEKK